MASFYCVKWGDKYSPLYVNRLNSMLKRQCSTPFEFFCYTDDASGIDKDVNIIHIEDNSKEGWWYKLDLLKNIGSCIVLDLDVIILKDPIQLLSYETKRPTVISSLWKNPWSFYKTTNSLGQSSTLYNSSIIKWKDDQGQKLYHWWEEHSQEMMLKYSGIDRMLWNENECEVDTFPEGIVYSYWLGNKYPSDIEPEKFREGFEICIFNHEPKMDSVTGWPLEYWK